MSNSTLDYSSYLHIDEILEHQQPLSDKYGKPAHIEMMYIIVHQAYELWFKCILHELDSVIEMFQGDFVNEKNIGIAVRRLDRVIKIQHVLLNQIDVLETMTPLEFLDFRNLLGTASGFQSFQYRLLENRMGLKRDARMKYMGKDYLEEFSKEKQDTLKQSEDELSLLDAVGHWLERTPFLKFGEFSFVEQFQLSVSKMLKRDKAQMEDAARKAALDDTEKGFKKFLNRESHEELLRKGRRRLSYDATISALFISLYRDEPILQLPFKLLESLMEIDENFTAWRSRHAMMVHRMLGRKMGTGESSGFDYLKRTVEQYRVFTDLFNLSTYLIPRSELPEIPEDLKRDLGFYYSAQSDEANAVRS